MRRLCLILFALVISLPAYSQARHPFTFEDMMKLKRVGEPVPSPDGKWVLFSVVDVDLEKNTRTPHVWIVPLGSQTQGPSTALGMTNSVGTGVSPVQAERSSAGVSSASERILIPDQDGDRPRWAPDGKRFAFISTKEGGSQVWIADFDGASGTVTGTHKLTSIATEASGELWLPDGKDILFVSDVYPECDGAPAEEQECNAKKLKEREESKVKALIFEHLLYRHWNAYREGKRTHIFVVAADARVGADVSSAQSSAARQESSSASPSRAGEDILRQAQDRLRPYTNIPRDLTPGDYDSPVFSLGGQDNYAFSPDGQEICYTSNHDPVPAISTNNDLWIVPVNVGTAASAVRSGEAGPNSVELRSTRQPGAAVATQSPSGYVSEVMAQTRNLTADNLASDSTPLYSPDGKYIAYRAQQRPGYESDRFRLMLYDRKTRQRRSLTGNFDRWVDSTVWSPDSRAIYFTAGNDGGTPIYSVNIGGQSPKRLTCGFGTCDSPAITSGRKTIVFSANSLMSPAGLFMANLDDKDVYYEKTQATENSIVFQNAGSGLPAAQVEHLNASVLSQIAMSPLESFWFTGALGDKVQGFLVKPPNFDPTKKYPVKFLIHGGPQGAWGDDWSYRWNPELFAASGYVVVMINFHGSTGYGQKFIDAINGDWGGAPFEDLMKGLDYAEQHYPFIDKDRECALGASYGGYMVNWILGHTNRFKCLVSHDGMFNATSAWGTTEELWFNEWEFKGTPYTNREMYRKWSPHLSATSFKTPALVIHGQRDYRLDVSEGFQLFTTLQRLGVPSKMLYFPDEGHWVLKPQNSQLWYKTVNDWVDQWLKK